VAQLKQENDELREELANARQRPPVREEPQTATEKQKSCADEVGIERNILRQEIHALQVPLIFLFLLYQFLSIIGCPLLCVRASQSS
jgi:hypothetical protein